MNYLRINEEGSTCRRNVSPQRQKPCSVKYSSKSPLDLLIIDQQGSLKIFIIGWEREAWVQYFMHPRRFKTLIPADIKMKTPVNNSCSERYFWNVTEWLAELPYISFDNPVWLTSVCEGLHGRRRGQSQSVPSEFSIGWHSSSVNIRCQDQESFKR